MWLCRTDEPQIVLHDKEDLVESEVYPGLEDAHEQLIDVFDEMEGQLDKEMSRVGELVDKMGEDPGEWDRTTRESVDSYGCRILLYD